ncbi:MAG: glycoside hydrolase family 2 TIM barrel-domain containing protein, partial [Candidatus Omnitrophota bacterium]
HKNFKLTKTIYILVFSMVCGLWTMDCFAQDATVANEIAVEVSATVVVAAVAEQSAEPTLKELVAQARKAKDKGDFKACYSTVDGVFRRFGKEARQEQRALKDFPPAEQMEAYDVLNNVAMSQFIKAEALKKEGKKDEAMKAFRLIAEEFSYAQAWDPRGWYFKLAATAQEGIDRMLGKDPRVEKCGQIQPTNINLHDAGTEEIVDYAKYGEFSGAGTSNYKYTVKDQEGLSGAVGEGIYPNTTSVRWDPAFVQAKKDKKLTGSHWDFVNSPDLQSAFLKWAVAPEPPGVKLFYTAFILEKAGLVKHAIKAYYAIVVHFPYAVGWTYWHTPWYVGPASIAKIQYLCKNYPQVNMKLVGAKISVENSFDNDVANDKFIVDPGKLMKNGIPETLLDKLRKYIERWKTQSQIRKKVGTGKVRLVQYKNDHWQLLVDNKPYMIKGITYAVSKVGQSPDEGTLSSWMEYDYNKNGKCDGPYDAFVDKNRNNKQDADEPAVGDFQLMKDMGVNTIRLYHQPSKIQKEILRDLYKRFGIRVIMGDFLGKYALGSGAEWDPGTDYENPEHRKTMLASVRTMVEEFKDEPYVLMWLLGNENVYGVACNADKKPETFFKFVNEAALLIKSLDREHPVAIASGDTLYFDRFAKHCPDVDVFGANAYRGDYGFGSYWQVVRDLADKPAIITEYGCGAYVYCWNREQSEEAQAQYLKSCWEDIVGNSAFEEGSGNAIGGISFEWLDEWWKGYEPAVHDTKGLWVGPFPDGYMHEEWLGNCGQGDGTLSPFLRHLRKSYTMYQKLWKK